MPGDIKEESDFLSALDKELKSLKKLRDIENYAEFQAELCLALFESLGLPAEDKGQQ